MGLHNWLSLSEHFNRILPHKCFINMLKCTTWNGVRLLVQPHNNSTLSVFQWPGFLFCFVLFLRIIFSLLGFYIGTYYTLFTLMAWHYPFFNLSITKLTLIQLEIWTFKCYFFRVGFLWHMASQCSECVSVCN